ncbi:MAG: hypothetical protein ACRES0_12250 [Pseudomonas sp.]
MPKDIDTDQSRIQHAWGAPGNLAPNHSITAETPSDRQSLSTLAILSTLMAFASISTDLYLPALPAMAGPACQRGPGGWSPE